MLTFHEGLPGAGKTYEAVKSHLLPAVKSGRKVFTNIKGIKHQAIADYCGVSLQDAERLVISIPWEKTKEFATICENDSLCIIDEVQDFWPRSNKPLSLSDSEFVTQHRQRGLELVACGQVLGDCHSIWKNRVERKLEFVNREAVGKPNEYIWRSFNAKGLDARRQMQYEPITSGGGKYEAAVYDCYGSHQPGVQAIEKTKDDRFNVFKTSAFYIWIPLALAGGLIAVSYLYKFFHPAAITPQVAGGGISAKPHPVKIADTPPSKIADTPPSKIADTPPASAPVPRAASPGDYVEFMLAKYRPRLVGIIKKATRVQGYISFLDDGYRVQETLDFEALKGMGWSVAQAGANVVLEKGGYTYLVTSWPIEPFGSNAQAIQTSANISGRS